MNKNRGNDHILHSRRKIVLPNFAACLADMKTEVVIYLSALLRRWEFKGTGQLTPGTIRSSYDNWFVALLLRFVIFPGTGSAIFQSGSP